MLSALFATALGAACGGKSSSQTPPQPENQPPVADPLAEDMARFCARTDTAAPPSEWGPAAYAEAKTDELRGALDEVKQGGALPAARSRLEELASKAGVGECAAVATWPKA